MFAATSRMPYNPRFNRGMEIGHAYFAAFFAKSNGRWKMLLKDTWQIISVLLRRRVTLSRYRRAVTPQCGDGLKTRARPFERSRRKDSRLTAPATPTH